MGATGARDGGLVLSFRLGGSGRITRSMKIEPGSGVATRARGMTLMRTAPSASNCAPLGGRGFQTVVWYSTGQNLVLA